MAEKTLKQLEAEYASISEKNRKAYDALKGTGQGVFSWQNEYNRLLAKANPSAKDKARLAELKPKFDAAQAEYKKTQEAKNAAKAALDKARKAETTAKETSAKLESSKSVYDKAMANLRQAEATISGYKGEQGYIDAYKAADQARKDYVKAGGTPPELPTAKVTIPATPPPPGAETGGQGEITGITSYTDALKFLTDPANKEALIKAQKGLVAFGYKGNTSGNPDKTFTNFLNKAAQEYASLPEAWRTGSLLDYLNKPITASSTSTGAGGTTIKSYVVKFDPTQAQSAINNVFTNLLGRDVTTDELKVLSDQLIQAQENNPTKYKITTDSSGNVKESIQTGGLDVSQFVTNLIKSGASGKLPTLKDEYVKIKLQDPAITKLETNKKLYETAMAKAGMDIGAKQKVKETSAYGRGLKELQTQVADYVINQGGTNTPDEIASFAQDLYDRGYDLGSEVGLSELQNFIKYKPTEGGTYTGKAGTAVASLASTAKANGLDLNKNFSGQLEGWLRDINKGEPIENIKQKIREVAKIGMPDNVKKLIDNGMDLESIYSPYRSTMANVLEIANPDTINMSDPTLRAAITGEGEVPLYQFERALRKDSRWQYTKQAHQEVADATRKILQDFGFTG